MLLRALPPFTRWLWLIALLLATWSGHACLAGDYPERTIKIVVPFPAGGPTDVAARLIAQSLATKFGKGVVVENHPGAGGRIGAKVVASAEPDGHTLLLGGTNVNAIGTIYKDLSFDPVKSFAPISVICVDSLAIAISPQKALFEPPPLAASQFCNHSCSSPRFAAAH